ncbi:MAG: Gfo/Idh/MocA family oxidoreductase [Verrucomicrobia bacterium]|nr:Gfo/Idh/MocA family oxidoreductase [Verrucomicrobiota bacterium]
MKTTTVQPDRKSRREFLRSTAKLATGCLIAPHIVPASALGVGSTPPSERVNVGLISCGGRAMYESRCLAGTDKCQLVAVCDPQEDRRLRAKEVFEKTYAERKRSGAYKGCDAYADFRDVLARADVDAVYIATPDHWHVPITIAAARAGKDMHTEKPLGVSIAEDIAAREAVRRYGRVFQYGAERRSTTAARHAIELVLNGRIGKVQAIHVVSPASVKGGSATPVLPVPAGFNYDLWLGPAPEAPFCQDRCLASGNGNGIFHIYDYAIGFIAGWAAHPLDQVQWWADNAGMGIPVNYEGTGTLPDSGLFNCLTQWDVRCRYESGLPLRFMDNSTASQQDIPGIRSPNAATFVGTEGWVSVGYSEVQTDPPSLRNSVIGANEIHLVCSNPAGGEYAEAHHRSWIDCVRSRKDPVGNIESAVRSDLISHLSDICVRVGRPIRWDPVKETIVGDEAARRRMSRAAREPWAV